MLGLTPAVWITEASRSEAACGVEQGIDRTPVGDVTVDDRGSHPEVLQGCGRGMVSRSCLTSPRTSAWSRPTTLAVATPMPPAPPVMTDTRFIRGPYTGSDFGCRRGSFHRLRPGDMSSRPSEFAIASCRPRYAESSSRVRAPATPRSRPGSWCGLTAVTDRRPEERRPDGRDQVAAVDDQRAGGDRGVDPAEHQPPVGGGDGELDDEQGQEGPCGGAVEAECQDIATPIRV